MKINIDFKGKKFLLDVKKYGFFKRFRGLMFRKKENANALLFEFDKKTNLSLHSFFVFFSFLVLWLDDKNNIVDIKKCKPFQFRIITDKKFSKIVEIPLNKRYKKISRLLVGD